MLAQNGVCLNGHANGHTLVCESDYPAVEIDVTPSTPTLKWQDQFPQFTHNVFWIDSDGISHSMTLGSDSLQDILSDLKLLKGNAVKPSKNTLTPILRSLRHRKSASCARYTMSRWSGMSVSEPAATTSAAS
jgi:hypothetical protein